MSLSVPDWVGFPRDDWQAITPREAGLDADKWARYLETCQPGGAAPALPGGSNSAQWGAAVSAGGYLLHTWGDPEFRAQTASVGKGLTWAVFGLAVEDGRVKPDDLVRSTWTGAGQLSHPQKHLDQGHHRDLTWRHLLGDKDIYGHLGGFPVTNGFLAERHSGPGPECRVGCSVWPVSSAWLGRLDRRPVL